MAISIKEISKNRFIVNDKLVIIIGRDIIYSPESTDKEKEVFNTHYQNNYK